MLLARGESRLLQASVMRFVAWSMCPNLCLPPTDPGMSGIMVRPGLACEGSREGPEGFTTGCG